MTLFVDKHSVGGFASHRTGSVLPQGSSRPDHQRTDQEPEKGINVYYIQCGVPVCEEIKTGIEGATKALGWKLNIVTHQDSPIVQQAWQAVTDANPDLVLASGNPREWFEDQLATLDQRKVPVVVWSLPKVIVRQGLSANLLTGDDYYFYGVLMADYIVSESAGKANSIFFGLPIFPVLELVSQGFETEYKRACPSCQLKIVPIDIMDLVNGQGAPGGDQRAAGKPPGQLDSLCFRGYAFWSP